MLVGGTGYYIEALLWTTGLVNDGDEEEASISGAYNAIAIDDDLAAMSDEQLHEALNAIDPEQAACTHPRNRKRLIDAIRVCEPWLGGKVICHL